MKLKEAVTNIESVIPKTLIEKGDNSGLLIGELHNSVAHIRVALEATVEVVSRAVKDKVDLLLVHHPLIFSPVYDITSESVVGSKVIQLIKNNIALYAVHSNLDRMEGGLNQRFGERMGLEAIEEVECDTNGFVLKGRLNKPMALHNYVALLCEQLNIPRLSYAGDDHKQVTNVGFCTGSGMSFVDDLLFTEIDVMLTGDLKYHDSMWIHESDYAVVDVTHFGSEQMSVDVLYDLMRKVFKSDIIISKDEAIINPIKISEV